MKKRLKKTAAVFLSVCCLLALCSCALPGKKSTVSKSIDEIYAAQEVSAEQENDAGYRVAELILSKKSYRVITETETSCELEVTAPDVKAIIEANAAPTDAKSFDPEIFESDVDALMAKIEAALTAGGYPERTVTVTVPCKDGKIQETYELTDAFYGGLLSARDIWVRQGLEEGGTES